MAAVLHEATQHSLQLEFSDGMSADYMQFKHLRRYPALTVTWFSDSNTANHMLL